MPLLELFKGAQDYGFRLKVFEVPIEREDQCWRRERSRVPGSSAGLIHKKLSVFEAYFCHATLDEAFTVASLQKAKIKFVANVQKIFF